MMPAEARVVLSAPRLAGNTAVIEYAQRAGGNVHIAVYDMLGRRMATLEDSYQSVGTHRASWNVADSKPGIYFVRVNAAGTTVSRTLLILK
jgi:ketol-acid reductoisomerase